ncbi:MAG: hypothetical protein BWY69_00409 [Planctomycetes bacterium ADurb.Bin401]|nr:MAG: hypothetical protein BWY69_00409 [Planctomycetes bacterium ADurb.Bin401]
MNIKSIVKIGRRTGSAIKPKTISSKALTSPIIINGSSKTGIKSRHTARATQKTTLAATAAKRTNNKQVISNT